MKTDVVVIDSNGDGIDEALLQTEKAASYRGLDAKQTLRLRLLAEEMTGMLRTIVGKKTARYWIEAEGKTFALHLSMKTIVDPALREELLKTSTSGKNAAAKGFMGRLKDIILQMNEQDNGAVMSQDYGYYAADSGSFESPMGVSMHSVVYQWSMQNYKTQLRQSGGAEADKWDELEKSITARLADEIKIFINGGAVEMVIEKTF